MQTVFNFIRILTCVRIVLCPFKMCVGWRWCICVYLVVEWLLLILSSRGWLIFFAHHRILEKSTFSTNWKPMKKKVDWRLWYLNFGCDVTSYIYRSSYTRINVLVCLITFIFVIGINFEWDFGGFFKGFFPSVIVACGFILCFRDENESTYTQKGQRLYSNGYTVSDPKFHGKKHRSDANLFWWMIRKILIYPLHESASFLYMYAQRGFFNLWTHLNQIHCALWFVHKCTSMECLIQSTWNQNMGNKTKSSASIYEFRFCELETKKKQRQQPECNNSCYCWTREKFCMLVFFRRCIG